MSLEIRIYQPETILVRQALSLLGEEINSASVKTDFLNIELSRKSQDGVEGYLVNGEFIQSDVDVILHTENILLTERVEMVQEVLYSIGGGKVNLNTSGLQKIELKVTPEVIDGKKYVKTEVAYYDIDKPNRIISGYSYDPMPIEVYTVSIIEESIRTIFYQGYAEYMKEFMLPDRNGDISVSRNRNLIVPVDKGLAFDLHAVSIRSCTDMVVAALERIKKKDDIVYLDGTHRVIANNEYMSV